MAEKSILEAGRQEIERIEKEAANEVAVDVATVNGNTSLEASVNRTTDRWSLTAYVKKIFTGPWTVGGRGGWKF